MFTVGLISKEYIKTYNHPSFDSAKGDLKELKNSFIHNYSVKSYTTIIERDECGIIESIKYIFRLDHSSDLHYVFLSKNRG